MMKSKSRPPSQPRLVSRDGRTYVLRTGDSYSRWSDLYHLLINLSWPKLLGLVVLLYLGSNAFFAFLYCLEPNSIKNAQPGSFLDAFFFSVQTMATIGYGAMYPQTVYANVLVAIEALVGLLGVAMATGLMFARFSVPTARVLFSDVAVINSLEGIPTLKFRAANQRRNLIVEAQIRVTLARDEFTPDGQFMRRLHDLSVIRSRSPVFALTWTVMHPIDETSPLYGETPESLAEKRVEVIITLTGLDASVSQTVHARHSFVAQEIFYDMEFVDIFSRTSDGKVAIDYTHFHQIKSA